MTKTKREKELEAMILRIIKWAYNGWKMPLIGQPSWLKECYDLVNRKPSKAIIWVKVEKSIKECMN